MDDDYLRINRANWDSRVPVHAAAYDLDAYRRDPDYISSVVRFDLPRLGSVSGLDVVHLQCHIGTDTLSLARLGARMTGLDFSTPALEVARSLAEETEADIEYVEADVYRAPDVLGRARFDVVFTGIGALCWLPSVARWADVVSALLKPGGRLFIREGHPMLWSLADPRDDGIIAVEFPYFETKGTRFFEPQTYVEHEGELAAPETVQFNHGLGEIITAVTKAGLRVSSFEEHTSIPWNPLGAAMERVALGEWQLRDRPERLAASYTLQAIKR
ncbi:MAG: class I SAM-dependent methyltransferase [Chloroflexota bacterium]|nr:class I SAM-dependent methyltransferase [Chloroflexota bacterium]